MYLNENYNIDSSILLTLIQEEKLPVVKTLHDIPYIHSGYVSTLIEQRKIDNVREDTGS